MEGGDAPRGSHASWKKFKFNLTCSLLQKKYLLGFAPPPVSLHFVALGLVCEHSVLKGTRYSKGRSFICD